MWNILAIPAVAYILLISVFYLRKRNLKGHPKAKKVAFFHPFWYLKIIS